MYHENVGFRRMLDAETTPTQQKALHRTAKKIHAEQLSGRQFTYREFYIRLLTDGVGMSETDAARCVDEALASKEMPTHLRAMLD